MSSQRKQILVIGMADSVHLARWLSQFVDQSIDFTLFPSSPHRRIHPILKNLIASTSQQMTVTLKPPSMQWLALPLSALDIPFNNFFRSQLLRCLITQQKFDLIHVLELQHAGYLLLGTKLAPNLPKVFITNWGSDIYWFQQFPKHKQKIIQLLNIAKFYSAECQRDIEIVRHLGYVGKTMPVIPNSGGINMDEIPKNSLPPSQRKKIMIKGYTGFVGQALVALRACELAAKHLREYEVVIYSASIKSRIRAIKLRHVHKVRVTILKKRTPHHEMLKHFSEARVYIGISLSDGISTSLLEAMTAGCYPIQTDTSCANEWLSTTSGSVVPPNSVETIADALIKAIQDNDFVDLAAVVNTNVSSKKAGLTSICSISQNFYREATKPSPVSDGG
jgi:glycosyltransferase involved in cell wall biosynthesis